MIISCRNMCYPAKDLEQSSWLYFFYSWFYVLLIGLVMILKPLSEEPLFSKVSSDSGLSIVVL